MTFWAFPVFHAWVVTLRMVTKEAYSHAPVGEVVMKALICPASQQPAVVEWKRCSDPAPQDVVDVIRCSELPGMPVVCNKACLRLDDS